MHSIEPAPLLAKKTLKALSEGDSWAGSTFVPDRPSSESGSRLRAKLFPKKYQFAEHVALGITTIPFRNLNVASASTDPPNNWQPRLGWVFLTTKVDEDDVRSRCVYDAVSCLQVGTVDAENFLNLWAKGPNEEQESSWLSIEQRIAQFEQYEEDWNGDGAAAIPTATIKVARHVIQALRALRAPAPSAAVAYDDGEIELQWQRGGGFAALSVDSSQRLVGVVRAVSGKQKLGVECDQPLRADLSPFVRAIR